MIVLRDENSNKRIDILGITTDELSIIEMGLKSLVKNNKELNPDKIYGLIKGLNDELKFFDANDDRLPMYAPLKENVYEYVDLGLPSGTLWADRNIGASNPEDYGLYFAWGETVGYTAKEIKERVRKFNKSSYKAKNVKADLTPEQDAAHANMGGKWRMPTKEEFQELNDNCTSEWTKDYNGTGVAGRIFTSKKNRNSVFFPAAGDYRNSFLRDVGSVGSYWSASWDSASFAWGLGFNSVLMSASSYDWYCGRSIRGVCE